jgi:hypothetical protein
VKKFSFPLETARTLRRRVWEQAEETLLRILAEERQLARRRRELAEDTLAECRATLFRLEFDSRDLARLERIRDWAAAENLRLEARLHETQRRAAEQRTRLIDARRQYEVLESLREKQYELWLQDLHREEEKTTAELFSARWKQAAPG